MVFSVRDEKCILSSHLERNVQIWEDIHILHCTSPFGKFKSNSNSQTSQNTSQPQQKQEKERERKKKVFAGKVLDSDPVELGYAETSWNQWCTRSRTGKGPA
jgi:hypothetical protein